MLKPLTNKQMKTWRQRQAVAGSVFEHFRSKLEEKDTEDYDSNLDKLSKVSQEEEQTECRRNGKRSNARYHPQTWRNGFMQVITKSPLIKPHHKKSTEH